MLYSIPWYGKVRMGQRVYFEYAGNGLVGNIVGIGPNNILVQVERED